MTKRELTFVSHIAEEPSQRLVENISASVDEPVETLLPPEHRRTPKIKLDYPTGLQPSIPLGTVRLSRQARSFVRCLVEIHGKFSCLLSAAGIRVADWSLFLPSFKVNMLSRSRVPCESMSMSPEYTVSEQSYLK